MSEAQYFAQKADQLLRLVQHIRETPVGGNAIEVALIALANEFMEKAEQETLAAMKKSQNGNLL